MEWIVVVGCLLPGLVCLLIGYALGARRGRRIKRELLQDLTSQSLELLDTRASLHCLERYAAQQERKDKLLKLSLRKLQQVNGRNEHMAHLMSRQNKQHYVESSRLRMHAVEYREKALQFASIARQATAQLKRLQDASSSAQFTQHNQFNQPSQSTQHNHSALPAQSTQIVEAMDTTPPGNGQPVRVGVVSRPPPNARDEAVSTVANRDADRLTSLCNSIQATSPGN